MIMYKLLKLFIPLIIMGAFVSCKENTTTLTTEQTATVKDSVLQLAEVTAKDVSVRGPIAWLDHFENSPNFFMANDGILAFPDYKTAELFIKNTLVKQIQNIKLKWSDVRVDALTPEIAIMAAKYHEDITDNSGKTTPYDGYLTATVEHTFKGWEFLNVHWSSKAGK